MTWDANVHSKTDVELSIHADIIELDSIMRRNTIYCGIHECLPFGAGRHGQMSITKPTPTRFGPPMEVGDLIERIPLQRCEAKLP
jgi:hypothetical protein